MHDLQIIDLWSGAPPGQVRNPSPQQIIERSKDPNIHDRAVFHVAKPSLTVFLPPHPNGAAVIIAPGGAYDHLSLDKEGNEVARRLNQAGLTAFVLTYRLPEGGQATLAPLQDGQRALRLIRRHAAEWGVNPHHIGAIGFSAGGHLVSMLATQFQRETYSPVDEADRESARPDFTALIYPVVSMQDPYAHGESRRALLGERPDPVLEARSSSERHVSKKTPPAFIVHAEDDPIVRPENSLLYDRALINAGVPAQLHIFAHGRHGFGVRLKGEAAQWPALFLGWLKGLGFLS